MSEASTRAVVTVRAARLFTPAEVDGPASLTYDLTTGAVTAVEPQRAARRSVGHETGPSPGGEPAAAGAGRVIDLGERIVVPGFVDVHTHGADGAQVNGDDADSVVGELARIGSFHVAHGTTTWLATTVTDSPERLLASVQGIARATAAGPSGGHPGRVRVGGARLAGAHLEGPFLARARLGAQDPARLRDPDTAELDRLLDSGEGSIRLVTIAPELRGALELIPRALAAGARVAVGHSDADFDTARRAFDRGASHVTHLFNAMAPLHHRRPGLVGAALSHASATLELIADLEHVHPAVLGIVAALAPERVVAVTDSVPAAGLGAGTHRLGGREVRVSGRRVELADDPATLAGSMLTMDEAVRNLVEAVGMPLGAAVRAATLTPASAAGLEAGCLRPGWPADFAVLEPDLRLAATVVGGRPAHDPAGLLA